MVAVCVAASKVISQLSGKSPSLNLMLLIANVVLAISLPKLTKNFGCKTVSKPSVFGAIFWLAEEITGVTSRDWVVKV